MSMYAQLTDSFAYLQQTLFEQIVQPLLFKLGQATLFEDGYDATGWLLVGLLQLLVMLVVIRPLERWRPVEAVQDRAAVRVDVLYTLLHRLGVFRMLLFFVLDPLFIALFGMLHLHGFHAVHLDQLIAPWWPGVTDTAWASFVLYLVVFDFFQYWLHRAQHQFQWWWSLHAVHHSQRQMTMWTDDRNHLLDSLLTDAVFVFLAYCIGVLPGQFIALIATTKLIESLSHANVRLRFGELGERLLVSPRYHRLHHGIGVGHESQGRVGTLGGHNFAVLFPIWDMLFGTANFERRFEATGIRDQLPGAMPNGLARDYGHGFWAQQKLGLERLFKVLKHSRVFFFLKRSH